MRTLLCLSAVLLAAALAGCAVQPKTVAAPEYDWAAGFEETCARLEILSDGSAIVTLSRLIQPF